MGIGLSIDEGRVIRDLPPLRARLAVAGESPTTFPAETPVVLDGAGRVTSVVSREALHRRLLALSDVAAASVALVILLNVFGQRRVAALALVGIAVLLFLFKVAGLYDRDALRLVHSTLDEVPLLAQLTGLFALGVAIMQSIVLAGTLSADKIAALWIASFCTIACGRIVARALAGWASPP